MNTSDYLIRLDFFKGLSEVVIDELKNYPDTLISRITNESVYLQYWDSFLAINL